MVVLPSVPPMVAPKNMEQQNLAKTVAKGFFLFFVGVAVV